MPPSLTTRHIYSLWFAALAELGVVAPRWELLSDQEGDEWTTFARLLRDYLRKEEK